VVAAWLFYFECRPPGSVFSPCFVCLLFVVYYEIMSEDICGITS